MKKHTDKFGLLIVDDNAQWRFLYRQWMSDPEKGHYELIDTWDGQPVERDNATDALSYIEKYVKEGDYHLIVISDAYMPPNCDGSAVDNKDDLFGGLWLIDQINKKPALKKAVSILLVTYYDDDEIIKKYRNGDKSNFQYKENEDYFFVEKPYTRSAGDTIDKAVGELCSATTDTELRDRIWKKTDKVLNQIIKIGDEIKTPSNIIGRSEGIKTIFEYIERVKNNNATVLITGESGTGKELVAKAIHYGGNRKDKPFVAINCGAMPENLIESELFGHEKGAFTGAVATKTGLFETANKSSIFLDEITELRKDLQVKLLRVIQEKNFRRVGGTKDIVVDVRIIAASNKNIRREVFEDRFREDLFYRLCVIPIHMPALRERQDDVPLLIDHFLEKFVKGKSYQKKRIDANALKLLSEYSWPGNVRELENILERLVLLSEKDEITADDVKKMYSQFIQPLKSRVSFDGIPTLAEVEKELFTHALRQYKGHKNRAAKALGVAPTTVKNKINSYSIEVEDF